MSRFQTIAFENELATFANAPQWQQALLDVAAVINNCSSCAIELILKTDEPSAILLFLTAHNHYLASVRSVSAGHCLATYPTGRAVIESALYSWYLSTDKEVAQRWYNKPTEKDDLRNWSKEFKFSELRKALSKIDTGLAKWANYLHQLAIDFGAHPNRDALYSNMEQERDENGAITLKMVYLHPWNNLSISTTKFTIETGMIAIRLFALGFPHEGQVLNLAQELKKLTDNLSHLLDITKLPK